MIIHKFLDDIKRLVYIVGPALIGFFIWGKSKEAKGRADAIAEQQEQREENAKEARKTDDEVSKMSEAELDDIARRNGWMLDNEDEDGRV